MESQNHLAAINDTLNVLIQRFDAMEARHDSSDARFEKLYRNFIDKCDMGLHPPFIKMTSPISFEKSNQVVLKLQSFHEEKIRAREKVDEFFSQYRPRYKPKSDPCLRPKLAKFKKIRNKHHNNKQREASVPIIGFESLLPATRLLLDSTCIQGSAFLVSNVQQSNCTDHGYERVGSVKERFKSLDFSLSDGIAIDFSIHFDGGFILDAKQMLIPAEVAGVHLGRNVFDELPQSTNNCALQLGYHMRISDSGGTLIILVCNVEFLQNGTRHLRHYMVASNFGDKESDESKIMAVGLYQFMKAQPTILENKCQKEWVGMYAHHLFGGMQQTADMASLKLGFHEFIHDKGGTKFLSSFESMDLWASCENSVFCVVFNCSMGYCKGIRDKGGTTIQRLLNLKSTGKVETILVQDDASTSVVLILQLCYHKGICDKGGGLPKDKIWKDHSRIFRYKIGTIFISSCTNESENATAYNKDGTVCLYEFNSMDLLAICAMDFVLNTKKRNFLEEADPFIGHAAKTCLALNVFEEIPDSRCCVFLNCDMCYCKGIRDKDGGSKFRYMVTLNIHFSCMNASGDSIECPKWLEEKPPKSVVYVSFGSMVSLSAKQMEELALGFKESGLHFLWVIRESERSKLCDGIVNSSKEQGLFVTNGNRIISRASGDHFRAQIGVKENKLHKEAYLETNGKACGFPPPSKLGYLDLPKKLTS